ncbi:hypothetical protein NMY22_g14221 [Coprinellus aureogranulatus]|nr:hypothetical protein NMY22_g14221 [Coprinellus aureogranulatus]
MHKREWDLLEDTRKGKRGRDVEVGGRKKRVKLSSSVTNTEDEDESLLNDEPQEDSGDSGEEEEIPHLVELGIKNERIENDIASCVESARAVQSALYSCQGWLGDQYPTRGALRSAEDARDDDSLDEDNASEASNPFLESPKPRRKDPSSPAHEGEDSEPCAEDLTLLSSQFFMAAQAALFAPPYASGEAEIQFTAAPIKAVLHDERERMKAKLPVDHARVKHDLEKALREAQKAERFWDRKKNEGASKAAFAVGRAAKGIMLGLQGDDEDEFKGVDDDGDSDSEEDESVGFKASLIVTLAMVQVTLVTCIVSEKKLHGAFDYSQDLPSSPSIQRSGKPLMEAAQTQKARRIENAAKEREDAEKRKNDPSGPGEGCMSDVKKLLGRTGSREPISGWTSNERDAADDEEEKKFDKLELTTLAAIKHLGLATFRLFFDLYSGADEWESLNPVPKFADHAMHLAGGGDEVEPLDPQRLGNLGEQEKISSWLKSVISSPPPSASGGEKDAEQPADSAKNGTSVAAAEDDDADKENRNEVSTASVKETKSAKKPKLSKNDKLASLWKSKKKTTKAQKEARTKALEMARQANIQRKEDEERKCVEAERRRAAALYSKQKASNSRFIGLSLRAIRGYKAYAARSLRQVRCYNPREAIEFNVLAAMIRMGRKYEIDYLRDEALVRLTMEFPTTLAEWDKLPHYYTQIVHQNGILFDIINLAQQSDIKSILPAAYYLCIQELDDLLLGSKREDGSMAIVSDEVRRDCVLGREKLLRAQAEQPFKWVEFMGAIDQCSQPSRCLDAAHKITKALWVPMPEPARTLEKWNEFAQIVPAEVKALCPQCAAAARLSHEEGRRYLWEHLPAYFGLPGWDELKNFDA